MRNQNQSTIEFKTQTNPSLIQSESNIKIVLNSVESAIREYQAKHKRFVPNGFKFFSQRCGHKWLSYFYAVFERRPGYSMTLEDAKTIYDETGDEKILESIITYFNLKEE